MRFFFFPTSLTNHLITTTAFNRLGNYLQLTHVIVDIKAISRLLYSSCVASVTNKSSYHAPFDSYILAKLMIITAILFMLRTCSKGSTSIILVMIYYMTLQCIHDERDNHPISYFLEEPLLNQSSK